MQSETNCDAVMIGRAAIGNPMIFAQVNALAAGLPAPTISLDQRFDLMLRYLSASVDYIGEKKPAICCEVAWDGFPRACGTAANSENRLKKFRPKMKHAI